MKLKFLFLALFAGILAACSLNNDQDQYCYSQHQMATKGVSGPDSTKVNIPIVLNVSFVVGNNCGTFNQFVSTADYPKSVVAVVDYTGCKCDTESTTQTKPYTFNATAAGTYVLKFLTENEAAPITKTITVTNP